MEHTIGHQIGEAAHNWGEYETGLVAGRLAVDALRANVIDLRTTQLTKIAQIVLPKVRERLEPLVDEFPFIGHRLEGHTDTHDRILADLG